MSKKVLKFTNKYSLIALAILLLCSVFVIGLHYFNEKRTPINNTINNTIEKEYFNKKYGFHLTLPNNIYTVEDILSDSLMVIYFVDQKEKNYLNTAKYGNDLAYNLSDSGKTYFALTIIAKNSSAEEDIGVKKFTQASHEELEKLYESHSLEKINYLIEGKEVNFYVITEKSEAYSDPLDIKRLPSADAFLEDENNIYHFYTANIFSEKPNEIMDQIEIMKEAIKSIKFDN